MEKNSLKMWMQKDVCSVFLHRRGKPFKKKGEITMKKLNKTNTRPANTVEAFAMALLCSCFTYCDYPNSKGVYNILDGLQNK